ncbi:MAG: glycosyltransferase family 1 protein [Lachnospiraceae bacterium]
MKILHIPTGGLFTDGIFSCIYEYTKAMDCDQYRIDLLATNEPTEDAVSKFESLNQRVIVIPFRKVNVLKYIRELYKCLRQNRYDIVHVHGSSAIMSIEMVTAWLAGCKVRIAHSHNTRCQNEKAHKILLPVFYRSYTHAFACGRDAGEWLFGNRKFTILPNGRDLKKYMYDEDRRKYWREQLKIEQDCLAVGHVGRFNEQKNHRYLISVFEELKKIRNDVKLVLMGTGELYEDTKQLVSDKGLSQDVVFMGNVENVAEVLSAMDVMVMPSLYEGLPIVTLEWQAAGLSCFLSDRITRECMVTDHVYRLPLQEPPAFWAKAIAEEKLPDRLAERETVETRMREAGYDIAQNAEKLKQLYESFMRE